MPTGVNTSAGTKLFIGSTTATQPDPTKDTYVEVAEIKNLGAYGPTYGQITHSSLGNRNVRKFKGTRDDGNCQLEIAISNGDAGQAAAYAAVTSDFSYNIKVQRNDAITPGTGTGSIDYFSALVMSFPTTVGTNMQTVDGTVVLGIQSGTIQKIAAT